MVSGLSQPMFRIIALAVLLAAVASRLVSASGLLQAISGMAVVARLTGGHFVVITFLLSCLVSFSTGTSVGTYFVVLPILFPAGLSIGVDPAFLIASIAAGGAFGDNLAPVLCQNVTHWNRRLHREVEAGVDGDVAAVKRAHDNH